MSIIKTEHSGAKNGGGFHGTRKEAKQISKTKRRQKAKKAKNETTLDGITSPEGIKYNEEFLLSLNSLRDWERPEEDEAWASLQDTES